MAARLVRGLLLLLLLLLSGADANPWRVQPQAARKLQDEHMKEHHHAQGSGPEEKTFFKLHDYDNNNLLDQRELLSLYTTHEQVASPTAHSLVKGMLSQYDKDHDGALSLEEYKEALTPSSNQDDQGINYEEVIKKIKEGSVFAIDVDSHLKTATTETKKPVEDASKPRIPSKYRID